MMPATCVPCPLPSDRSCAVRGRREVDAVDVVDVAVAVVVGAVARHLAEVDPDVRREVGVLEPRARVDHRHHDARALRERPTPRQVEHRAGRASPIAPPCAGRTAPARRPAEAHDGETARPAASGDRAGGHRRASVPPPATPRNHPRRVIRGALARPRLAHARTRSAPSSLLLPPLAARRARRRARTPRAPRLAAPADCLHEPGLRRRAARTSTGSTSPPCFTPLAVADAGISALDDGVAEVAVAFSTDPQVSRPDIAHARRRPAACSARTGSCRSSRPRLLRELGRAARAAPARAAERVSRRRSPRSQLRAPQPAGRRRPPARGGRRGVRGRQRARTRAGGARAGRGSSLGHQSFARGRDGRAPLRGRAARARATASRSATCEGFRPEAGGRAAARAAIAARDRLQPLAARATSTPPPRRARLACARRLRARAARRHGASRYGSPRARTATCS